MNASIIFSNSFTMLLSASVPAAILLTLGILLSLRQKTRGAISATLLAMGISLLVLMVIVVAGYSLDALRDLAMSMLWIFGLPLVSFAMVLGTLAYRQTLSILRVAACGTLAVVALWYLGGFVLNMSACAMSPSGGC